MSYCSDCGTQLPKSAQFCPQCGKAFGEASTKDPVQEVSAAAGAPTSGPAAGPVPAGLGRRFFAHVLDGFVALALFLVIGFAIAGQTGNTTESGFEMEGGPAIMTILLTYGAMVLYFIIYETFGGGRSFGKQLLGLRVVRVDGTRVGLGGSIVRNLLRLLDGNFAYLVGLISALISKRNQRLGDMAAGTMVVRTAPERQGDKQARSSGKSTGIRFSMGTGSGYLD